MLLKDRFVAAAAAFLRLHSHGQPRESEVRLQGSVDWNQLWSILTAYAQQLHLRTVRLDVNAPALREAYHARWNRPDDTPEDAGRWRAEVPLAVQGQTVARLEITGERDSQSIWLKIALLAQLLENFELALSAYARAAPKTSPSDGAIRGKGLRKGREAVIALPNAGP